VPRITDFCSCMYVFGCRLSLVRLCNSDYFCCLLLPHSTYFIRQFLVLVLFVNYCFGEIMCIWDSYVYQKDVLCFLIHKSSVRSIKNYYYYYYYCPSLLYAFCSYYTFAICVYMYVFLLLATALLTQRLNAQN